MQYKTKLIELYWNIYMLQKHCIRAGLISGQGQKGNE